MPAVAKKRKVSTTRNVAGSVRGLDAFTKVSKPGSVGKAILDKSNSIEIAVTKTSNLLATRKRKLVDSDDEASSPEPFVPKSTFSVLPAQSRVPQTPRKHVLAGSSPGVGSTPTKGARNLLDRFNIAKTPTRTTPLVFHSSSSILEASTPEKIVVDKQDLPPSLPIELVDLINLHAAFLTALSLHYAHNGTHSPADLRNLCPDVARAWGKRGVILEDIRRSLGVLNSHIDKEKNNRRISLLSLSDYGHGKICVEIQQGKFGHIARPVDEDLMNEIFEQGLLSTWKARSEEMATVAFIESLPMEAITTCPSLLKMSPLVAKGQRRLEDMKAGMALNKENKAKVKVIQPASDGKKPTLLERLRAKQFENSTLPPPPSKEQLSRKQALQRIEEAVAVLVILSTSSSVGQQRISFTLPTVLGKLKDSFKTPMSKDEADCCIRLISSEIAPEWVKIVKMGRNEAVVVNRDERPTEEVVRDRVERAS
jgi:hypothetical protein